MSDENNDKATESSGEGLRDLSCGWYIEDEFLMPDSETTQSLCCKLWARAGYDPSITFLFSGDDEPETPLRIHQSILLAAGGALRALVSAPFIEARTRVVNMPAESRASFEVVRRFLYCIPIDFSNVPVDIPMVADKWGLTVLCEAYFEILESKNPPLIELCKSCLPSMAVTQMPAGFKRYFVHKFSLDLDEVEKWLGPDIWRGRTYVPLMKDNPKDESRPCRDEREAELNSVKGSKEEDEDFEQFDYASHCLFAKCYDTARDFNQGPTTRFNCPNRAPDSSLKGAPWKIYGTESTLSSSCNINLTVLRESLWEIIFLQGILEDVIRLAVNYCRTNYTKRFADLVLGQFEGRLSDEAAIRILRRLPWSEQSSANIIKNTHADQWSARGWQLLARAQTSSMRYGCDSVCMKWRFSTFHDWLPNFRAGEYMWEEATIACCTMLTAVRAVPGQYKDEEIPAIVGTFKILTKLDELADEFLRRRVKMNVHIVGMNCGCIDPEKDTFGSMAQPLEIDTTHNLTVSSIVSPYEVDFLLLGGRKYATFLERHSNQCGFIISFRLYIFNDGVRCDGEDVEGVHKDMLVNVPVK